MIENKTLTLKRIAVKPSGQHWQWFGPAVHFKLYGYLERPIAWYTANCVLESMCEEVVRLYGLDFCKDESQVRIVEASTEQAYELVDLRTL